MDQQGTEFHVIIPTQIVGYEDKKSKGLGRGIEGKSLLAAGMAAQRTFLMEEK
jgi:hypothetical protein